MADKFKSYSSGLDSPGLDHYAITPHDTIDEKVAFRSLWVGTAGNVALVSLKGDVVVYKNCGSGTIIPMRGKRVNVLNTTATDLIGMY